MSILRQRWGYFLRVWNLVGVVTLLLAACVSVLHLSRSALASHLWASLLHQRESFINFFPLGQQSQVLIQLSAMLLFLLVLKVRTRTLRLHTAPADWNARLISFCLHAPASSFLQAAHQLRFLREWAVFGRTLRRSVREIVSIALALFLLLLAYSYTGYLVSMRTLPFTQTLTEILYNDMQDH